MKKRKNSFSILLSSVVLLQCLSACSKKVEVMESDFTMLLNRSAISTNFITDLNQHDASSILEEVTGVVVNYESGSYGEESLNFLLLMVSQEVPDLFRMNLYNEYAGGVDTAIKDGFIHDITLLVEEHAPNFMTRISEDEGFFKSAYSDGGALAYFGAAITDDELRGLPFAGPMINETYLKEVGLDVPVTIGDWEILLEAFADLGIVPFSIGGTSGLSCMYDAFASAFQVTVGSNYFQVDGEVKFSPYEEGYFHFVSLFQQWYEKGWIQEEFASLTQEEVQEAFENGVIGATITSVDSMILGPSSTEKLLGVAHSFVPAPYPVLREGDEIHTRQYTFDFYDAPIYFNCTLEDPVEAIQWVDFFYSSEGIALTNWGIEGETYEFDEFGDKVFTSHVTGNLEEPPVVILAQSALQEMSVVVDWEYESSFYQEGIQELGFEVWGKADYDWVMPQTMTLNEAENYEIDLTLDKISVYVAEMTLKFIVGSEPLENWGEFLKELDKIDAEYFLNIQQTALNRYHARA